MMMGGTGKKKDVKTCLRESLMDMPEEMAQMPFNGAFVCMLKSVFETKRSEFDNASFESAVINGRGTASLRYCTPGQVFPMFPTRFENYDTGKRIVPKNTQADPLMERVIIISGGDVLTNAPHPKFPNMDGAIMSQLDCLRNVRLDKRTMTEPFAVAGVMRHDVTDAEAEEYSAMIFEQYFPMIEKRHRTKYLLYLTADPTTMSAIACRGVEEKEKDDADRDIDADVYAAGNVFEVTINNSRLNTEYELEDGMFAALMMPLFHASNALLFKDKKKLFQEQYGQRREIDMVVEFINVLNAMQPIPDPDRIIPVNPFVTSTAATITLNLMGTPYRTVTGNLNKDLENGDFFADQQHNDEYNLQLQRQLRLRLNVIRRVHVNHKKLAESNVVSGMDQFCTSVMGQLRKRMVSPAYIGTYRNDEWTKDALVMEHSKAMNRNDFVYSERACAMSTAHHMLVIMPDYDRDVYTAAANAGALVRLLSLLDSSHILHAVHCMDTVEILKKFNLRVFENNILGQKRRTDDDGKNDMPSTIGGTTYGLGLGRDAEENRTYMEPSQLSTYMGPTMKLLALLYGDPFSFKACVVQPCVTVLYNEGHVLTQKIPRGRHKMAHFDCENRSRDHRNLKRNKRRKLSNNREVSNEKSKRELYGDFVNDPFDYESLEDDEWNPCRGLKWSQFDTDEVTPDCPYCKIPFLKVKDMETPIESQGGFDVYKMEQLEYCLCFMLVKAACVLRKNEGDSLTVMNQVYKDHLMKKPQGPNVYNDPITGQRRLKVPGFQTTLRINEFYSDYAQLGNVRIKHNRHPDIFKKIEKSNRRREKRGHDSGVGGPSEQGVGAGNQDDGRMKPVAAPATSTPSFLAEEDEKTQQIRSYKESYSVTELIKEIKTIRGAVFPSDSLLISDLTCVFSGENEHVDLTTVFGNQVGHWPRLQTEAQKVLSIVEYVENVSRKVFNVEKCALDKQNKPGTMRSLAPVAMHRYCGIDFGRLTTKKRRIEQPGLLEGSETFVIERGHDLRCTIPHSPVVQQETQDELFGCGNSEEKPVESAYSKVKKTVTKLPKQQPDQVMDLINQAKRTATRDGGADGGQDGEEDSEEDVSRIARKHRQIKFLQAQTDISLRCLFQYALSAVETGKHESQKEKLSHKHMVILEKFCNWVAETKSDTDIGAALQQAFKDSVIGSGTACDGENESSYVPGFLVHAVSKYIQHLGDFMRDTYETVCKQLEVAPDTLEHMAIDNFVQHGSRGKRTMTPWCDPNSTENVFQKRTELNTVYSTFCHQYVNRCLKADNMHEVGDAQTRLVCSSETGPTSNAINFPKVPLFPSVKAKARVMNFSGGEKNCCDDERKGVKFEYKCGVEEENIRQKLSSHGLGDESGNFFSDFTLLTPMKISSKMTMQEFVNDTMTKRIVEKRKAEMSNLIKETRNNPNAYGPFQLLDSSDGVKKHALPKEVIFKRFINSKASFRTIGTPRHTDRGFTDSVKAYVLEYLNKERMSSDNSIVVPGVARCIEHNMYQMVGVTTFALSKMGQLLKEWFKEKAQPAQIYLERLSCQLNLPIILQCVFENNPELASVLHLLFTCAELYDAPFTINTRGCDVEYERDNALYSVVVCGILRLFNGSEHADLTIEERKNKELDGKSFSIQKTPKPIKTTYLDWNMLSSKNVLFTSYSDIPSPSTSEIVTSAVVTTYRAVMDENKCYTRLSLGRPFPMGTFGASVAGQSAGKNAPICLIKRPMVHGTATKKQARLAHISKVMSDASVSDVCAMLDSQQFSPRYIAQVLMELATVPTQREYDMVDSNEKESDVPTIPFAEVLDCVIKFFSRGRDLLSFEEANIRSEIGLRLYPYLTNEKDPEMMKKHQQVVAAGISKHNSTEEVITSDKNALVNLLKSAYDENEMEYKGEEELEGGDNDFWEDIIDDMEELFE